MLIILGGNFENVARLRNYFDFVCEKIRSDPSFETCHVGTDTSSAALGFCLGQ